MLITVFVQFQPEGHHELCNEAGSLSLGDCLVGFELGTFRFKLQHLSLLGHSPLTNQNLFGLVAGPTIEQQLPSFKAY